MSAVRQPGGAAGADVRVGIADHPRRAAVDPELPERRRAAFRGPAFGSRTPRAARARSPSGWCGQRSDASHVHTLALEQFEDALVDSDQLGEARPFPWPRPAGLRRRSGCSRPQRETPRPGRRLGAGGRPRHAAETREGPIRIGDSLVERAVAIEEDRGTPGTVAAGVIEVHDSGPCARSVDHRRSRLLRCGERLPVPCLDRERGMRDERVPHDRLEGLDERRSQAPAARR